MVARICNEKNRDGSSKYEFVDFHAPTHNNPEIPIRMPGETDEEYAARRQFELVDDLIANNNPLVYQQEHLAEFVDWSGVAFFMLDKMLHEGKPIEMPKRVDGVHCTIDMATKTGTANDGTAVVYWGFNRIGDGPPLTLLDWDVVQIEVSLLETWLPVVFQNCDALAKECKLRGGSHQRHAGYGGKKKGARRSRAAFSRIPRTPFGRFLAFRGRALA